MCVSIADRPDDPTSAKRFFFERVEWTEELGRGLDHARHSVVEYSKNVGGLGDIGVPKEKRHKDTKMESLEIPN